MKRTLLALTTALLTAPAINAQITLTNSCYTASFAGTVDTFLNSGSGVTYPTNLVPGTDVSWNMNSAVLTTPVSYIYNVSPYTATFPSAQFADSILNNFATYQYIANFQRGFSAGGYYEYGEHVKRQAIHAPTGANDSLIFIAQDVVYSSPDQIIKFPATYGTTWSSSYNLSFAFALDVALLMYTNEPGNIKQYVTETDTVTGWGQMKVKKTDGTSGGYQLVLQVRKKIVTIDSFFINGAPASSTVLTGFGVTQGSRSVQHFVNYYRPNEAYPLASVGYTDTTYTTVSGATTLAQDFTSDLSTGIKELSATQAINIYPNPAKGTGINISVPAAQDGNWSYELYDVTGAQVQAGKLDLSNINTTVHLSLSDNIATGTYYISLKSNGEEQATRALEIIK